MNKRRDYISHAIA